MKLLNSHVYPAAYIYPDGRGRVASPPRNLEEINRILTQPGRSLSLSQFPDEKFRKFQRASTRQVRPYLNPILEGDVKSGDFVGGQVSLSNLECGVDGLGVSDNPYLYHGTHIQQLDQRVRNKLSHCIMPSTHSNALIAPNFFLEVRESNESSAVAKRQARYHGALGVRGMQKLQSYGQSEPVYDENAYITSTCCDGTLMMHATHITPAAGRRRPEYHTTLCNGFFLAGNPDACRQGLTAYRNARDWAKE
jgi:hypothetical protein